MINLEDKTLRPDKDLIDILIDNIDLELEKDPTGICKVVNSMVYSGEINWSEHSRLANLIRQNKPGPSKFVDFTEGKFWMGLNTYWWHTMSSYPETKQIRIEFLKALKETL